MFQECVISDCGELKEGEDDGAGKTNEGLGDEYPGSPEDASIDVKDVRCDGLMFFFIHSLSHSIILIL